MDWSFCEALAASNVGGLLRSMHIYDVGCLFHQHFQERVDRNPYLQIPDALEIIKAIGLFHVHRHRDVCLYRYATTYVPGAGVVDGEILETIWAVLNAVSKSTRTATLAHRRELLDDHIGDSNFKKLVNIVSSVISKYQCAKREHEESQRYFREIDNAAPSDLKQLWKAEIEEAERNRQDDGKYMDIMLPRIKKGPTLKEVQARIAIRQTVAAATAMGPEQPIETTPDNVGAQARIAIRETVAAARPMGPEQPIETIPDNVGAEAGPSTSDSTVIDWLVTGMKIEDAQVELKQHVRRLPRRLTEDQKLDLARKRQRLAERIKTFHLQGIQFLGHSTVLNLSRTANMARDDDGNLSDEELPEAPASSIIDVECNTLAFPSTAASSGLPNPPYLGLEIELRAGKANDALQGVREALGYLSFEYITKVRGATTTSQNLRSWKGIRLLSRNLSFHRRVYNHSQRIICKADPAMARRYPPLLAQDCYVSTAISDLNAPGQSQARLPWFWGALDGYVEAEAQTVGSDDARLTEFYRIHWLRARAHFHRWSKEIMLTEHEMEWSTRFFMYKARQACIRRDEGLQSSNRGIMAYCKEQITLWNEMGRVADLRYKLARPSYVNIWAPAV